MDPEAKKKPTGCRALLLDIGRCHGSWGSEVCPKREQCLRYLNLGYSGPSTPFFEFLCRGDSKFTERLPWPED